MKAVIILFFLTCSIAKAQTNDTNLIVRMSIRAGVLHKPGHGAMFIAASYRPYQFVEFNLGPTFAPLIFHGFGGFVGVNGKLYTKKRVFVNIEFAYRFMAGFTDRELVDSIGNGIIYEYKVSASNFVSWGVGFNYRFKSGLNLNIMPTYNWKMGKYKFVFNNKGNREPAIEERLKARLNNGFGLTIAFSVY